MNLLHKNHKTHNKPAFKANLTFSQRMSDKLTKWAGSWAFIFLILIIMLVWILMNIYFVGQRKFDPYPFILLNIVLSTLAALQAPVILMSQNRAAERDRINAKYDYIVNRKAEREIRDMQNDLDDIKEMINRKVKKK